jgi:hypothetical protein
MFEASIEPSAAPAPHDGVQLVDEEHLRLRVLARLVYDLLEALLELAAVLRAGHEAREVQRQDAPAG